MGEPHLSPEGCLAATQGAQFASFRQPRSWSTFQILSEDGVDKAELDEGLKAIARNAQSQTSIIVPQLR
jgi:hypothetical protein